IFGSSLGVDATTASFVGLSILLLSGVLTWEDVKSEKGAWDTLIWFAALLMMANQLKKLGFTSWFGNLIGDSIGSTMHGTSWIIILLLLNAAYFYTHYFFASGNAQIAALYAVFLGVGLHLNIPAAPMALMLAFTSSLYCSLTQYTHARGPILFGAGYVPTGVWWRTGFIISLFNQAVFLTVGLAWWKVLGLY
ncbi:anion permease, partial [Salmonella enterica subsp. enterica serovar Braenderup]|nr:anion permease [Salmonella enterica subsp. enterica serovar Braenderup]